VRPATPEPNKLTYRGTCSYHHENNIKNNNYYYRDVTASYSAGEELCAKHFETDSAYKILSLPTTIILFTLDLSTAIVTDLVRFGRSGSGSPCRKLAGDRVFRVFLEKSRRSVGHFTRAVISSSAR